MRTIRRVTSWRDLNFAAGGLTDTDEVARNFPGSSDEFQAMTRICTTDSPLPSALIVIVVAFAGATTVTEVALTFVRDVPTVPPNVTLVVSVRFVPVMVTLVPPAIGPLTGDNDVIVGAATYVKPPDLVTDPPFVVVSTTF